MGPKSDLESATRSALSAYMRDRFCFFGGLGRERDEMGTGNLIQAGDTLLIATCKHIADSYQKAADPYLLFVGDRGRRRPQLKYVDQTDGDLDLAILVAEDKLSHRAAYRPEDLEVLDDFSSHQFEEDLLMVTGMPAALAGRDDEGKMKHPWLNYMTLPYEGKPTTRDFLYLAYPMGGDAVDSHTGAPAQLPPASGLSGSFVLRLPTFRVDDPRVWAPEIARVIAVQQSWNRGKYLKCTNIRHLVDLLRRNGYA